ncbi:MULTISPECIES: BatD family protein [Gammaproteobacteria]|uniref:BatD family protein n=1 Tax=Gammaproteobacteria TaxID=1236 RepID=UPI000DCF8EAD|nr:MULTISPECIES: BatD family protein [Gammaproteobacteria]RTE86893.1 protein BatD [Aliidiomarina sp. B3213]TCZ93317.1 protein BatD [Lysobacter sp. N42]
MLKPFYLGFVAVILILTSSNAYGLEIDVSVDRNPVIVNESFNLTVTADEDLPRWAFSSRPLMRDFVVGATSIDTSSVTSQGVTRRTTRWTVRLTAREPGRYTIPSFDIEGAQTQPIEIEVIEVQRNQNGENRPFFIEGTVSEASPYVQQQVTYTVDLFIHSDIPLENGTIAPPLADNANVEQITQNRERQEIINGQRYQVITQVYAITPQRSGSVEVQGVQFEGIYRQPNSRGFSGFSRPEQVSLMTPNVELNVQPIPQQYQGQWFVSEQVVIERQISPASGMVAVGEPITETVTITAEGVRPEQIPELDISSPDGLRVYPETPQQEVFARRDTRIGQVTYTTVYIPSREGQFELPQINIPWFNPSADQSRQASTAAVQLTITPSASEPERISPVAETETEAEQPLDTATQPQVDTGIASIHEQGGARTSNSYLYGALAVLFIIWLVTLILLIRAKRGASRKASSDVQNTYIPNRARQPLNNLKQACNSNEPVLIMENFRAWMNARKNDQDNGKGIRAELEQHQDFKQELAALEAALYGKEKSTYTRGKAFWKTFSGAHKKAHQTDALKLYPH